MNMIGDNKVFSHIEFGILLAFLTTLALAAFTWLWNDKQKLSRTFAVYTSSICLWTLGYLCFFRATNYDVKLLLIRLQNIPAIFIAPTFLTFVLQLTERSGKYWTRFQQFSYVFSALIACSVFHRWFVPYLAPRSGFSYYLVPGPIYFVFTVWIIALVAMCFVLLLSDFRRSQGNRRKQLSYTLLAYLIGYGGGLTVFLPSYGIPQPRFAFYAIAIAHTLLLYSIVAHQYLNLRVAVRRFSLLFVIYGALVMLALPILFYLQSCIESGGASHAFFYLSVFFVSTVLSFGPFLYAFFVRKNSFFHEHALIGLTHELKSPLAVIENALDSLVAGNNDKAYLEMISRNVSRLKDFVHDLLGLYGIDHVSASLDYRTINIVELCSNLVQRHQEFAAQKSNQLRIQCNVNNIPLHCDPDKIEQTISNLLSNALKHTVDGIITLTVSQMESELRIVVQDSGSGIAAADLPRVFDRFFQGTNAGKGTGIGLTIAKAWVEAHGGKIWAESDGEGKGATVMFTLPVN